MNKYTVVVKNITSSNGDYSRKRFNNVSPKIIKWLIKTKYNFKVGIIDGIINRPQAENYIEIFTKHEQFDLATPYMDLDTQLYARLEKYSK